MERTREEIQRKVAGIERQAAQVRAENQRRPKTSGKAFEQPRPIGPKVIEVEYDDDGKQPKVVEIKDQSADSEPSAVRDTSPAPADASPASSAEVYRDPAGHFTLDIPTAWEAWSSAELEELNQVARRLNATLEYGTAFRRRNTPKSGLPRVLVQVMPPHEFTSYADVESALEHQFPGTPGKVKQVERLLKGAAQDLSVGKAVLDRSTNRYVIRTQASVPGVGTVQAISTGHVGSERIVFLHCYADERDFSDWLPTFELLNDSFQFDEGYEFGGDASARSIRGLFGPVRWNNWVIGSLLGAVAGAVAGLIALQFLRLGRGRTATPQMFRPAHYGTGTTGTQQQP
jgi:hypothetical protein